MRPSMFMGAKGVPPAEFVGAMLFTTPSRVMPIASIPGIQVGDYVMIFAQGGAGDYGTAPVGWTVDNYIWPAPFGYRASTVHRKILTLDPITISGMVVETFMMAAYRGASRAVRKSVAFGMGSSLVIPGAVRAADGVGVVSHLFDRNAADAANFTPPSPWTRRLIASEGFFRGAVADALPRTSYADGASLTWSPFHVGEPADGRVGSLYELLR